MPRCTQAGVDSEGLPTWGCLSQPTVLAGVGLGQLHLQAAVLLEASAVEEPPAAQGAAEGAPRVSAVLVADQGALLLEAAAAVAARKGPLVGVHPHVHHQGRPAAERLLAVLAAPLLLHRGRPVLWPWGTVLPPWGMLELPVDLQVPPGGEPARTAVARPPGPSLAATAPGPP